MAIARRDLLRLPFSAACAFLGSSAPALISSERLRPLLAQGVQIGDALSDRAILWSRTDRPARMIVEYATEEAFKNKHQVRGPIAAAENDFTCRADLAGLPPDREVFFRIFFQDLSDGRLKSEAASGRFRTAPTAPRDLTFLWSGDTAGQGWGINVEWGGMKIYETMRRNRPDFFIHSGDTIYADVPILPEVKLAGGGLWKNLVTPAKSKVAETLEEFRGNYLYNLMDENVRRFNAEVPQIVQWDDHEVLNNWSPGKSLANDGRYSVKDINMLVPRARKAFLEYVPLRIVRGAPHRIHRVIHYGPLLDVFVLDMRSYRAANSTNRQEASGPQTQFLGDAQVRWLKEAFLASRATWKVMAADMPLGLIVGDGKDAGGNSLFEAVANSDGPPLGRELEIADLLSFLKMRKIRNLVWLTADVHYTAAHLYDPARARFTDFDPFWEFVSGPLHAGTFGPTALDNTFGPQVRFQKTPPPGQGNLPPSAGLQFYGEVRIDGRTQTLTVSLKDLAGSTLYRIDLEPAKP